MNLDAGALLGAKGCVNLSDILSREGSKIGVLQFNRTTLARVLRHPGPCPNAETLELTRQHQSKSADFSGERADVHDRAGASVLSASGPMFYLARGMGPRAGIGTSDLRINSPWRKMAKPPEMTIECGTCDVPLQHMLSSKSLIQQGRVHIACTRGGRTSTAGISLAPRRRPPQDRKSNDDCQRCSSAKFRCRG